MRTLLLTTCVLCLAAPGLADEPSAGGTMGDLSRSAQEQLAQSTRDLSQLNSDIEAEKLPLAQELTVLEEKLRQLRSRHAEVTRIVDSGNLDLANVRAVIKVRQEELGYVGNVLDEYVRNFETRINVAELQYLGAPIETAKQAPANNDLSMQEKFDRQLAFVLLSIKRAMDAMGGMRFAGVGVNSQGQVVDGQFAIIGPVALFRANDGATAGVVIPQTGSNKPLIRPLEGQMQVGLAKVVETGQGMLPLDPSRGAALKALVQKTNLMHIFHKGGPIMWPLLFASILALGTVLERVLFLMMERLRRDHRALNALFTAVGKGDVDGAVEASSRSKYYVVRALNYALRHKEESLQSALLYAQAKEIKRYQRGVPILDTVITLAPLLGLLGTVTGMMGSFALIGGELSAPGAITGGIAEALIATAFGLGIAITALIPFNYLNARIEEARHEISSAATQLELLVRTGQRPTPPPAPAATPAPAAPPAGASA